MSKAPRVLAVRLAPFLSLDALLSPRPGWKLAETQDIPGALAIARRQRPDVILVKVNRADERAEEACRALRAAEVTAGVPIILVCDAAGGPEDPDPEYADARLVRPTAPEMRSTIAAWLRVAAAESSRQGDGSASAPAGHDGGASKAGTALAGRDGAVEHLKARTVIDNLPDGVVVTDLSGRPLHWNRAALRMHGYEGGEDEATFLGQLGRSYELLTLEGQRVDPEEWPVARLLRGDAVRDLELVVRHARRGWERVFSFTGGILRGDEEPSVALVSIRDVTARKRTESDLREADRRKSEFLAVLSHELRNPLAPIRNSAYVLEHAGPGSLQARRAAEVIERQTRQLTRLVDDLLEMTRISQGRLALKRELLEMNALVRRCGEDHQPTFEDARLHLTVEVPDRPVHVNGDPARLSQVISNLLANAAKFTAPGGHVAMALEAVPGHALVRVRDDGAGIPTDLLPRVFEPFVQGESTIDRARGGLGLGLAVLKGLVELHGGRVSAHSDGPGRGAEFVVELPAAPVNHERRGQKRLRAASETSRRVLIIEDNPDTAGTMKDVLELQGHDVEIASTGPEGIEKARALKPDVVLCDIGLPAIDGLEVGRTLRADPALASTRLVAVSGHALPEDVENARNAGFDRHVAKPVDPEDLVGI